MRDLDNRRAEPEPRQASPWPQTGLEIGQSPPAKLKAW